jgi:signal peptidase I
MNQSDTISMEDKSPRVSSMILNELWEELLYKDGTCWGTVISNSMNPLITRGDQVMVEIVPAGKLHFGDIIVFKKDGLLVTHRMLGKRKHEGDYHSLEKGDALLMTSLVPTGSIIGIVRKIRKLNGKTRNLTGIYRFTQLILSCISCISLWGWHTLEYCLTFGGKYTLNYRIQEIYSRFFTILRKITVTVF